ncbi:MAG: hypothetical protein QNJ54_01490 [Prochloraceae cyanobacterium]|nr:hypothetical protein [Prochloraceae cyanobacterium]
MNRTSQKRWDAAHPEIIKKSHEKFRKNNPQWGFRPKQELREWLETQRQGEESNSKLVQRLLTQLKESA